MKTLCTCGLGGALLNICTCPIRQASETRQATYWAVLAFSKAGDPRKSHPCKGVLESFGVFLGCGLHKLLHMLLELVKFAALPCGCSCFSLTPWHPSGYGSLDISIRIWVHSSGDVLRWSHVTHGLERSADSQAVPIDHDSCMSDMGGGGTTVRAAVLLLSLFGPRTSRAAVSHNSCQAIVCPNKKSHSRDCTTCILCKRNYCQCITLDSLCRHQRVLHQDLTVWSHSICPLLLRRRGMSNSR